MRNERTSSKHGLENHGITNVKKVHWNYNAPMLYEEFIRNGEGSIALEGPLVVRTGSHTGRATKDKFIVKESENESHVWWAKK